MYNYRNPTSYTEHVIKKSCIRSINCLFLIVEKLTSSSSSNRLYPLKLCLPSFVDIDGHILVTSILTLQLVLVASSEDNWSYEVIVILKRGETTQYVIHNYILKTFRRDAVVQISTDWSLYVSTSDIPSSLTYFVGYIITTISILF